MGRGLASGASSPIRGVEMTGMGSAETRGQMVNSLWLKLNARLAAETPAKPPLVVGGKTQAQLQTALTELPGKKQAVETAVSLLNDRRATLPTTFTIAPGTYAMTMTAVNADGESAPSAVVVLTVA